MVLLGTLVNTVAIIIGSLIGMLLNKIPEKIKVTVSQGMSLAVILLGIQMGFKSNHYLIVIGSLVLGGIIGEWLDLEVRLNQLGTWIEKKIQPNTDQGKGDVAKAFVTATLVFVVGSLAIIGALNSGLQHDHRVLYTKAMLDGFFSVIFATTLGFGVLFAAIPVFLYEGGIALGATEVTQWIPSDLMKVLINEVTATGGILIMAIGLNLLQLIKIKTANLLPSLVVCVGIVTIHYMIG
ncbi:membrane protein [Pullulanibacillus camelliae]|uniref:Membrane protein n=1 Tax=Pullulanibacillus camelliae TaxID=1707096 RepID=A0A8J2YKD8_9BACL|nr:DUF554 domain-containing protein [Pullulanibacillus camelliae]GGE48272.1 membrane protein [Pullulanibacillus camelliae]